MGLQWIHGVDNTRRADRVEKLAVEFDGEARHHRLLSRHNHLFDPPPGNSHVKSCQKKPL